MATILYGERFWFSPYVFSAFVALREKGASFEVREIALDRGEQRSESYRLASLTSRVPALDHDGFVLAESSAIVEYVDEVFPGPSILPKSPRERARARQVMAWIRSDLLALREQRSTATMFYEPAKAPLDEAGKHAAAKLLEVSAMLLGDRGQLFGDVSVADLDLAFMLQRLLKNGHPVPDKVRSFAEAMWKRPSVAEFVSHPRPDFQAY